MGWEVVGDGVGVHSKGHNGVSPPPSCSPSSSGVYTRRPSTHPGSRCGKGHGQAPGGGSVGNCRQRGAGQLQGSFRRATFVVLR